MAVPKFLLPFATAFSLALVGAIRLTIAEADDAAPAAERAPANEPTAPKPVSAPASDVVLADEQAKLAEKYKELERVVLRMAEVMQSSDPRRAALLRQAFAQSRERQIGTQFEELVKLLKTEQLYQASKGQVAVDQDLNRLLQLLMSGDRDKQIPNERAEIKRFIERINKLIREQQGIAGETEGQGDAADLANRQDKLANRTVELAKDLQKFDSRNNPEAGDKSDGKNADGKSEDGKSDKESNGEENAKGEKANGEKGDAEKGNPQGKSDAKQGEKTGGKDGKSDGKKSDQDGQSEKAGEKADGEPGGASKKTDGKKSDGKKSGKSDAKSAKDGEKTAKDADGKSGEKSAGQKGSKSGQKAGKSGEKSNQKSDGEKGEKSDAEKSDAEKSDEQKSADEKSDAEKSEGKSGQKSSKSGSKSGQKSGKSKKGGKGEPQEGEEGEPQNSESQPSEEQSSDEPQARKRIRQAEDRMRDAKRRLEEAERRGAIAEQQKAIEELKQAKAALEEILRQLREEEVERVLAMLEGRFRKMLQLQVEVYEGTIALDRIPEDERDRNVEIEAGKLSRKEADISTQAEKTLALLREEGSSVAFPESVEQMREDMEQVTARLARANIGQITQGVEQDIVKALEEMVAALQKAQKEQQRGGPQQAGKKKGGGGGQPQDRPLVNAIAELKMIRALQVRVNTRTERYSRLLSDGTEQAEAPDLVEAVKRLSEREQRIHKTTRDIVVGRNK